jgi:N-acetylmuramoyl-L-alanine amidase
MPKPMAPDAAPGPLRLPKPEEHPDLFAPATVRCTRPTGLRPPPRPGFQVRLPQPAWWKRPSGWIVPLAAILALLAVMVARLPQEEIFPPVDGNLPVIVVDAGHGGHDSGALGNGLCEKQLTLDTALRLEKRLRQRGFRVVLTRNDDRFLSLFDRPQIANELPNALFVSIHYNDNTTASGDGVETFYAVRKAGWLPVSVNGANGCEVLAQCVQSALVSTLGVTDRGAKPRQLAVVRYARCPAVLVEGGFINNPAEARKLALPEYREMVATAIADGVAAYQQLRTRTEKDPHLAQR